MAEGARNRNEEAAENYREVMRRNTAEPERKGLAEPRINDTYLGDVSARLFELQGERARLEGASATAKEIKEVDKEIAALQAFVDEHAEDYRRMKMPAEKVREAKVIPLRREKAEARPKAEAPRDYSTELADVQKRYDLTAKQLATETDPDALAELEGTLDGLRENIHALKADLPWQKEDRVLAKGGIKRSSSSARLDARAAAQESFGAAEIDRATLVDLRDTTTRSLASGTASKIDQTILRGAVQTMDDALARYGRGDLSAEAFQKRAAEISDAARKREETRARVTGHLGRIKETARAKKVVEAQAETEKIVALEVALSEAAKKRENIRARLQEGFEKLEKARSRPSTTQTETEQALDELRRMEPRTETEKALDELRRMPPPTGEKAAPPPENLPVAPERYASEADIAAKVATYKKRTAKGREDMFKIVLSAMADMSLLPYRERKIVETQYTNWTEQDFEALGKQLDRENREVEDAKKFRAEARGMADELVKGSVERTTAKIEELQKKIRDEQRRLSGNVSKSSTEERFFAQGENPEELAKREQALERSPELPPDEAVTQQEQIQAKSARDFENEISFTAAFLDAVEKDPLHRISLTSAQEYAKQYWQLLMKDNARLVEAMKPQPKVGFFRRLFGGARKPMETLTPQQIIQFQKMDKQVREIMETPDTSERAAMFRSGLGKSDKSSSHIGIGRKPLR